MSNTTHHLCLNDLKTGDTASVKGYTTEEIPMKLYDMGLMPGSRFKVYKKAPFKGPICITIGVEELLLALRSNEAKTVLVEKIK